MKKHLYDTIANRWLKPTGNTVWIFSDPHFGDFEAHRFRHVVKIPDKKDYFARFKDGDIFETYETFVAKEMKKADEELVKKINSKVGKNDTIIILGDVGDVEYVKKIKGYKVLLLGNHDKGASNYKRVLSIIDKETNETVKQITLVTEVSYSPAKYRHEDNHLFDEVYEGPLMINDRVILSHEPIEVPEYMFNIHGHVHDKDNHGDTNHLNVCAEAINYTPINLLKTIKDGLLKDIKSVHELTVKTATERASKKKTK